MPACWAIAGVGQRRTTHLVLGTRVSEWTGFHQSDRYSFIRSSGTSDMLRAVVRAADADVGVHLGHARLLELARQPHLLLGGVVVERAQDFVAFDGDERQAAGLGDAVDEGGDDVVGDVVGLDQHLLAGLDFGGVADQDVGEFGDAGVFHGTG